MYDVREWENDSKSLKRLNSSVNLKWFFPDWISRYLQRFEVRFFSYFHINYCTFKAASAKNNKCNFVSMFRPDFWLNDFAATCLRYLKVRVWEELKDNGRVRGVFAGSLRWWLCVSPGAKIKSGLCEGRTKYNYYTNN